MNSSDQGMKINRPAFFDWLVFSISFSLGFIFPGLKDFVTSPSFPFWMLTGLLLYTTGAWLKHLPICYRVTTTGEKLREVPALLFLLIGHWIIIFVAIIFSAAAIDRIFHSQIASINFSKDPVIVFINIFLASFITWIVYRSKSRKHFKKRYSPSWLFRRELLADILLISGVSILSFIFWDKSILAMLTHSKTNSISAIWFLFFMLGICFMLFYLPLRYLYLIEDHTNNQTWKRLLIIFVLILLRSLFEMLRI